MIQLEPSYWGKCIFCIKPTGFRIKRDDGPSHEVCEPCAQSSKTIECADERYAIILESFEAEQRRVKAEFRPRKIDRR